MRKGEKLNACREASVSFLALRCLDIGGFLLEELVMPLLENIRELAAGRRGAVEWDALDELLGWLVVYGQWNPQMAVEAGLWRGRRMQ